MEPAETLQLMVNELLPEVVAAVARAHRLYLKQTNKLDRDSAELLQSMIRSDLKDPSLLGLVGDEVTIALGLTKDLVEMKLSGVINHTFRRFLFTCYISQ